MKGFQLATDCQVILPVVWESLRNMQIHGHRCGRRRVGVVCMCCPRMWVAMVLTGSGRSLHHAAAASDSGCGGSGGGRVVVASKHRSCPRRRGKPARVIQLKASFNHTAVHPTPRRRYFGRGTLQHRRQHFNTLRLLAYWVTSFDDRYCLKQKV